MCIISEIKYNNVYNVYKMFSIFHAQFIPDFSPTSRQCSRTNIFSRLNLGGLKIPTQLSTARLTAQTSEPHFIIRLNRSGVLEKPRNSFMQQVRHYRCIFIIIYQAMYYYCCGPQNNKD
jgi:hypothetical protein